MVVGIKDIAAYVGLSTSTVSRALNGYDDVAVETVKRVRDATDLLGYYPSASARNLRRQRTDKIGLALLYDSAYSTYNEFFAELIRLVAATAEKHDYNLVLFTRAGQEPTRLKRIAQTREVDGLLVMGDMPGLDGALRDLLSAAMPVVIMGRAPDHPAISFVYPDMQEAARLALCHLVELGHRRIGHISFVSSSRYSRERYLAYRGALDGLGLPFDGRLVTYASLEPESGARAMADLLALDAPPTAVYAYNDRLAIEVLQYLSRRGLRVPQEMAVIGFDDIRSAGMTMPPLSTIRYSLNTMAEQAVLSLLRQRAEPDTGPLRLKLPAELVIRRSTVGQAWEEPWQSLLDRSVTPAR